MTRRITTNGDGDDRQALSAQDRATLLRKYRLMVAWRKNKDHDANVNVAAGERRQDPQRNALRDLAQEFPGALRELDVLGLAEMSRRISQLAAPAPRPATSDTRRDPARRDDDDRWIAWILAYHGLMRAALLIKRTAGPARRLSAPALTRSLRDARATCCIPIDESFAHAVVRPAGGRLTVVVLTKLARHFGASATEISRTLFPPRRAPPYSLES